MDFAINELSTRLAVSCGEIFTDLQFRSRDFKELDQRIRERARQLLLGALPVQGPDEERLSDLRRAVEDYSEAWHAARQRVEDLTARKATAQGPERAALLAAIERDLLRSQIDVADAKAALEQARVDLAAVHGDVAAARDRLTAPAKREVERLRKKALADLARDVGDSLAELLALIGVQRELDRHADDLLRAPLAEVAS